jgi:integrase
VRVRPRLLAENGAARSAAPWTVALDTGMRKSEIAGLLWSDVDFSQGRILV